MGLLIASESYFLPTILYFSKVTKIFAFYVSKVLARYRKGLRKVFYKSLSPAEMGLPIFIQALQKLSLTKLNRWFIPTTILKFAKSLVMRSAYATSR